MSPVVTFLQARAYQCSSKFQVQAREPFDDRFYTLSYLPIECSRAKAILDRCETCSIQFAEARRVSNATLLAVNDLVVPTIEHILGCGREDLLSNVSAEEFRTIAVEVIRSGHDLARKSFRVGAGLYGLEL